MYIDKLHQAVTQKKSVLLAGIDPRISSIPSSFRAALGDEKGDDVSTITNFYCESLPRIAPYVIAVKPNLAFFEQYGIRGLESYQTIASLAKDLDLLVIADAKRGDIGSTAEAYAEAFLGEKSAFLADALTVNPYLGLDTLEPYLGVIKESGKGIYVLLKTSNSGSGFFQDALHAGKESVALELARWMNERGEEFLGTSGFSNLGAVVGATYPEEALKFRKVLPKCPFLIPGFGAQGGGAAGSVVSISPEGFGGVVNASRGLFSSFSNNEVSKEEALLELEEKACGMREELWGCFAS